MAETAEGPSPVELPPVEELGAKALDRCLRAAAPFEFTTFQVGIKGPKAWKTLPPEEVHAYKSLVKRFVGRALHEAWPERGLSVEAPELLLVYDVRGGRVERTSRSLYLYGRYRKLLRGLPQTRANWRCKLCRKGCEACQFTGLEYPRSLEDELGEPLKALADAKDYQLHGMGREDVDVRCLEGGRPFVMELKSPRKRFLDLAEAVAAVNAARPEAAGIAGELQVVAGDLVGQLKERAADKRYLARVEAEGPLDPAKVAALVELSGATIQQRTPSRVAHRRADLVRERRIEECVPGPLLDDGQSFEVELETQSGTYIKELISSDEGRSAPSFSELLGVPCACAALDVLAIRCSDEELLGEQADLGSADAR